MSRYCVFRYRVTKTRYRDFFPDIGTDIGKKNADIGTISGHTRSLPKPISGFSPISSPIWSRYCKKYRDIRISGSKKLDIVSDVEFFCMQYRNIPISCPCCASAPPPAAQALTRTRRPLSRPRLVQPVGPQLCRPKGQCLGYCLHACAQRATAEIALVSGGATYSESLAKLET